MSKTQPIKRPQMEKTPEKRKLRTIIPARLRAKTPAVPAGRVIMAITITILTKVWSRTMATAVTARSAKKKRSTGTPRTRENSASKDEASSWG
jgi:hypothetical protein